MPTAWSRSRPWATTLFQLDERHQALVGQRTGETFALGDRVKVELVEADPVQGTLLFRLDAHEPGKGAELARAAWKKGGPRKVTGPRPPARALAPPPLLTGDAPTAAGMARPRAGHADRDAGRHDLLAGVPAALAGAGARRRRHASRSASTPRRAGSASSSWRRSCRGSCARLGVVGCFRLGLAVTRRLHAGVPALGRPLVLVRPAAGVRHGRLLDVHPERGGGERADAGRDPRPGARRLRHPVQPGLRRRARWCWRWPAARAGRRSCWPAPCSSSGLVPVQMLAPVEQPAAAGGRRQPPARRHLAGGAAGDGRRVRLRAARGLAVRAAAGLCARPRHERGAWPPACSASGCPATSCSSTRWAGSPTAGRGGAVMAGCTVPGARAASCWCRRRSARRALLWPLLVLLGGLMGGLYTLSLALIGERFRGADLTQRQHRLRHDLPARRHRRAALCRARSCSCSGWRSSRCTLVPPLAVLAAALLGGGGALAAARRRSLTATRARPMLRGRSLTDFEDCRPWRSPPPF